MYTPILLNIFIHCNPATSLRSHQLIYWRLSLCTVYIDTYIQCFVFMFLTASTISEIMSENLRYKGRFVKQKVLDKRQQLIKSIDKGRIRKMESQVENETKDDSNLKVGKRIIDVDEIADNLECKVCDETLSLKRIKSEIRTGLHSTFFIQCKKCFILNIVETGKVHVTKDSGKYTDLNTKVVFGALHAGIGCTTLSKVLACANIPPMSKDLYKRYERKVGPAIEAVAKESCQLAAEEERQLVIKKIDELCKEL